MNVTNINNLSTTLGTRSQIMNGLSNLTKKRSVRILAMYNSVIDLLIDESNQDLMVLPIDDRMANRAHGIMETGNIKGYKFSMVSILENHIDRLYNSARIVGINIPMTRQLLIQKVHDTAHLAYHVLEKDNSSQIYEEVLVLKIWVSGGFGDFGIYGYGKVPNLYVAVYITDKNEKNENMYQNGVKEYVCREMWQDMNYFANAKTVNYLQLSTMADYSKKKGGYLGLKIDRQGYLLEGAISNVAFLTNEGVFGFPPLTKVIKGTTLNKAIVIVKEKLGIQVQEMDIKLDELNERVVEMFHLSNDHVIPIISVDDKEIGDGKVGQLCRKLQEYLNIENQSKQDLVGERILGLESDQGK